MNVTNFLYAAYILVWPALTLGVLIYICRAVWTDMKNAKANNEDVV